MGESRAKFRLIIAEEQTLLRAGIKALLENESDFHIIGDTGDGGEAVRLCSHLQPDLLLIDLSMPRTDGTEAIRIIRRRDKKVRILVVSGNRNTEHLKVALEVGANGYVLKADTYLELITALRAVLRGKTYISAAICAPIVCAYLADKNESDIFASVYEKLTSREQQILKLVAEGHRNREIAHYLCISVKTVEKHRANLRRKLNLHNASELTSYAIEQGVVSHDTRSA